MLLWFSPMTYIKSKVFLYKHFIFLWSKNSFYFSVIYCEIQKLFSVSIYTDRSIHPSGKYFFGVYYVPTTVI